MGNIENVQNVVEAVMFALGREISIEELSSTLKIEKEEIEQALENLKEKYHDKNGVVLIKVKDMFQLVTNKIYYPQVNQFIENTKRQNLSTAALETLSIIAYNPKITKSEIENIRGVNSDFAVGRLLECGLVEEVARLNLPGRPAAYSVTNDFLKSCGIEDVSELPKFEEIKIQDEQLLVSDFQKEEMKNEAEKKKNESAIEE